MAQLGANVIATDFSTQFLERALARNIGYEDRIAYHLVDATHEEEILLLNSCFQAGLALDGLEEPAFDHPHDGSQGERLLSWINYHEIPPVLVARLRILN